MPASRVRRTLPALALAAVALAPLAGPSGAARAAAASGTAVPLTPATAGAYFGVKIGGPSAVTQLEAQLGRQLAIDHHFLRIGRQLSSTVRWDVSTGRIPLLTFGSGGASVDVIAGRYDAYFGQLADSIRALGRPIFLRYLHEMDAVASRKVIGTPAQFIAAWQHVHDLFAAHGVTSSAWVWEPTGTAFQGSYGATTADKYYPGDGYVDWVAADLYNWGNCRGRPEWRSFAAAAAPFYAWGLRNGKPMMVSEFGTVEGPAPTDKANWYADMARALPTQFPAIRAVVYFDDFDNAGVKRCDWRPTTSAAAMAGFVGLARTPWLAAR